MGISLYAASLISTNWGMPPCTAVSCIAGGLIFGLIGTLLDSLLGAVLQNSTLVPSTGKVASKPEKGGKHLSGIDLLSNEAVNFWSVNATALIAAFTLPV